MTKSCFQIWVSKMTGDYDRYLTQAVEKMKNASNELAEEMECELDMYVLGILPIEEYKHPARWFTCHATVSIYQSMLG